MYVYLLAYPLQNTGNTAVKKAVSGVFWELQDKHELQEKAGNSKVLL